jgi:hypothetical protein
VDVVHINADARTYVFEIVGNHVLSSNDEEELVTELEQLIGVAWASRGYGEKLADISLDPATAPARKKIFEQIEELFLARGFRLHQLDRAA